MRRDIKVGRLKYCNWLHYTRFEKQNLFNDKNNEEKRSTRIFELYKDKNDEEAHDL